MRTATENFLLIQTHEKNRQPSICTKLNNSFDGEPDTPIEYLKAYEDAEIEFLPNRITW